VVDLVLPEDSTSFGLTSIAMTSVTVSNLGVEQYERAGYQIARLLTEIPSLREGLISCDRSQESEAVCYEGFVRTYGQRLWRRPLTEDEVETYTSLAVNAAQVLGDFWQGLEFAVAGLLQSPHMIYRTEYGESDPEHPGVRRLTALELATKLSYLIWGTGPSDALIELARAGGLETPEQVRAEAERMIHSDRARTSFDHFWNEYFELIPIERLSKDRATYPEFNEELARSMREETLRLMEYLVFETRADMREMFTTRKTFLNASLRRLYGLEEAMERDFSLVELPETAMRAGVLGHASLLSVQSHALTTSPTHRGLFIRQSLMCTSVPSPPPDIDTRFPDPPSDAGPQTLRQRLEDYFSDPNCGLCHAVMDYLGFGLEHYDAIGRWRGFDNGLPIDASGIVNGVEYTDGVTLGFALAADPVTMNCMVRKAYRHAVGRIETMGDQPLIHELSERFAQSGYRFKDLILDIVSSEAFFYVQEVSR
jgi:hypothetical protein